MKPLTNARAVIAGMTAYTLELRDAEIKLNQNESPFDMPAELKQQVLARAVERPWNIYPDFEADAIRAALAEAYALDPGEVLAGNGSNELLAAAIATYVGPGTPVILPRPTFSLYEKLIAIAGGHLVPIDHDPDSGYLPLDEMLAAAAREENAVIIVCSPNNPTGAVLRGDGLPRLLATGAMVLFDRAYGDFAHGADDARLPALRQNLVTFSTFSKAWGLAALRIGWLASTAENCREIRKVKLPYNLNIISEEAAIVALRNRTFRDRNVACAIAERERVMQALHAIPGITPFPSAANFIAFRCSNGAKELFERLSREGVLVRDVSSNIRMQNCLRVSMGSSEENDRFLELLRAAALRDAD